VPNLVVVVHNTR